MAAAKHSTSRLGRWAKAAIAACALLPIEDLRAQTPVAMELVLAVDTSMSVDGFEYDLLMQGIARAFRKPEIIRLIGQQDGLAVALFQWSSDVDARYVIPWRLLTDEASVLSFAAKVEGMERYPKRRFTAVGGAIDFAVRLIAENAFSGRRLKIDVSGDGRSNTGVPPSIARQRATARGIVINGLPILTRTDAHTVDLDSYYREKVIRGPGAFIEVANDYGDFARAFARKLEREIAPAISRNSVPPRAPRLLQIRQATRSGKFKQLIVRSASAGQ